LPDYHGLADVRVGRLAGYGFGVRSLPGNWWHDKVAEQVGVGHPALQDIWCLVSLAVAPEERRQGIGAALMETLLAAQPCPCALLFTELDNTTAQRLYACHGWTTLHPSFAFKEGDQAYVVMRRELAR
jgi:ribosomal protein S18 acetylase RimI-like enzyme